MTLIKAWECDFAGPGDIFIKTAMAASLSDRTTFGSYQPLTRYTPTPGNSYGYATGAWWADNNHSQSERIYLPMIFNADATTGSVPKVNIAGGRFDVELCTNNLHLDKYVQLALLVQWYDPEANAGRGSNVNYLRMLPTSIDEQLGYDPPPSRALGGQSRTATWTSISIDFPVDDEDTGRREDETAWLPIDGRPDKVAANIYARSTDMQRAYECELLNLMIVCHCGQNVPTNQPPARPAGGVGELYIRKAELWIDPDKN